MTTVKRALESAIEALNYHIEQTRPIEKTVEAIAKLKSALAELESVEPVGYVVTGKLGERCSFRATGVKKGDMVFTSPQTREWVGLTDVRVMDIYNSMGDAYILDHYRVFEKELRELNEVK